MDVPIIEIAHNEAELTALIVLIKSHTTDSNRILRGVLSTYERARRELQAKSKPQEINATYRGYQITGIPGALKIKNVHGIQLIQFSSVDSCIAWIDSRINTLGWYS